MVVMGFVVNVTKRVVSIIRIFASKNIFAILKPKRRFTSKGGPVILSGDQGNIGIVGEGGAILPILDQNTH